MRFDERVECLSVDLDVATRSDRRHLLRGPGQAERAVAAWVGAQLAEVADERLHLAALVLDEREHALDPLGLRLLAALEALGELVDERRLRRRPREQSEALPHVRRLQLDEPALLEVVERAHDPLAVLAGHRLRIDRHPRAPGLPARDDALQELGAALVERLEDVAPLAARWPHAVAR